MIKVTVLVGLSADLEENFYGKKALRHGTLAKLFISLKHSLFLLIFLDHLIAMT